MTSNAHDADLGDLTIARPRTEIVFIEDSVADLGTLLGGIGRGKEVVILDSGQDGLHQIAQALAGRSDVDAVHIVSHGAAGTLNMGTLTLDAATLNAHDADLHAIGSSLRPGGDILLYGCETGADAGFVDRLALATGADVAASSNPTGSAALGGDWDLEVRAGQVETPSLVTPALAATYQHVLALSNKTVSFDTSANFISRGSNVYAGANADVVYKVDGNVNYQLRVDAANTAVAAYAYGNAYANVAGQPAWNLENKVTLSFDTGQVFTLSSIQLGNFQNAAAEQNLVFTAYAADGHKIGTQSVFVASNTAWTTANLGGFQDVKKLTITTTDNNGYLKFVALDNLVFGAVHAPIVAPVVSMVDTTTADGVYRAGGTIHVTVQFDEAVTVDTAGGTPTLTLETGTTDRQAVYASGSGTNTLTFDYTVQAGDTASRLDYTGAAALALNGGTIKAAGSGLDATLTLPTPGNFGSLGVDAAIAIDTTAPAAPSAPALATGSDTGTSNSDHITNDTTPTFTGTAESGTTITVYDGGDVIDTFTASGGTYSWTPSTPLSNGNHTIALTSTDAAGNVSAASDGNAITIDTTAPTVTVTSDASSTLKAGDTATVTFTFSEDPGTTFTAADVVVSGGTLSALSGTGATRTATFTPTANTNNGTGSVAVTGSSYIDAAGNFGGAGTALQIAYDTKAPTLTIASDKATLAAGETATITFTFSEDPGSSFTADDIAVSGGTLSTLAGTGTTRTATFTPDADVASGTASITVAAGGYVDAAGNTGGAGTTPSLVYHTLVPAAPAQVGLASASDTGASNTDGITNLTQLTFSGTATAGATVKLYDTDGTTQIGSGSADGAGNWVITTTTLSEGAHTVVAKAVDGYGSASAPSAGVTVTVDTTAPTLTIASDKSTLKAGETATVTFTFSEDPGATFTAGDVNVSGGTLSALSGSGTVRTATFTPAADTDNGHASIGVDAGTYADAAGNNGAARTSPTLTFDTKAPGAPAAPDLASASDSGTSSADDVTNVATPTFTGTAGSVEAGATVKLYDGAAVIATTTAAGDGSWSVDASALAEGAHTITATAVDAAGNESAASSGLAVTIDRTAPATQVAGIAFSDDTGTSHTDLTTSNPNQTITVTFGAAPQAGDTVRVSLDNGATWTTPAVTGNTVSLAATLAGSNTLKVQVTDAAGNAGAVHSQAYVLDTAAPAAPSAPDLVPGSDTGRSDSDDITSATLPTFAGTAESGATVTLYDGTTAIGSGVATGCTWQITATTPLGQGSHTITATATDAAGNASGASAGLAVQVITAAPTTHIASLALSADSGTSAADFVTNTAAQTISGTLSAALQTGERVEVSLDNGATWTAAQVNGTAWSLAATLGGSGTLQARVVDAVDNAGPVASQAYVLDTAAPAVTITSDAAALKIGATATITFTFSEDPGTTFTWDGTQGDVAVSGGTLSAISGSGLVRTATFTPDASTNGGTASITIAAGSYVDAAGNTGGAGTTPSLHFDTLAPNAPSAPQLAASTSDVTRDTTPTFTGTAEAGATVTLYDTDGTTVLGSTVATNGTWSIDAATLGEGAHTVTARATDAVGNASTASSGTTFTVDTTAPTVTIGSDASALKVGETATITFTFSEDPGASFAWDGTQGDLVVSGGTLSAVTGTGLVRTATFTPEAHVNGGAASITIAAGSYADRAGNDGAAGSLPALHFDTLAPAASSTPVLDAASDTGSSHSDGITAATTPTFTGTAEAGATVKLYEGSTLLGSAVATGGTWSITSSALGAGQHTVSTIVTDAAGNASGASGGLTFTVDLAAPTTAVGGIAFSADHGASNTDFITNTAAQTISGTLGAALQTGERVEVSLDNGATWTAAQVNGTAWSLAATLGGSGTLQARVVDAVDNAGPVASQAYVLDTAAPTLTIASDTNPLKAGETATITFTFSENPGATFTAADVAVSGGQLSPLSGSGTVRTAVFTPDANLDNQTASITVAAGSYADAAGNAGSAGTSVNIYFDTLVPGAPPAPVLSAASDTGSSATDTITNVAAPTLEGKADPHAVIFVYEGDARVVGITGADGTGAWHVKIDALAEGDHILRAVQYDAIGNMSPFGAPLVITVDTHAPAAPAAPLLAAASDSGTAGDHITKVKTPTFSGTAEGLSRVTLYDTDGTTALGSTQADAHGNWSLAASPLADGAHVLTVRQVDVAGNESAASPALTVTVDATAPAAPAAPQLQAQSDTDTVGDGITYAVPVIEGTAAANDLVTLYDGTTVVGTTHADAHGHWSIAAQALGLGRHTLSVTDTDAAGNVSAASGSFALTVEEAPVPLVDGVPVVTVPVVLPGGASGTQVQVPIVGAGRVEQTGAAATADIPLAGGTDLLVAHVGIGYGLTASGGPNTTVANGGAGLIAAIQAATPSGGDQAHMSGNGQSYLAQLQASQSLLVQTIAPVSSQGAPDGVLTLSAGSNAQQQVALVIQTGGLAPGGTIALQNVDFAAIVGAANVVVQGGTQMLTGDAASQHITLASGGNTQVFSGGGDDTIGFGVPAARTASASGAAHADAAPAPATTVLHGGTGSDTATFAGARADFDVETHNGYLVVSSKAAPAAKALVVNVEQLQFSDATVKVEDSGTMDTLAGIYQTALGRQADMHGIEFWADARQAGVSWGRIALDIIRSPEYAAGHDTFNGNAEHDVAMLYQALFDRAPDAPGLAFWVEAMRNGVSLEHIATEFVESVEMIGHQRAAADWDFTV
ncbi:Ig-like domain (group 3) [Massilia sp. PDC64]|nr:Ig-like domain-containing protein [Massilia sp. PDC64]SDE56494.1 Ig-like domain (group 3) [Massilia sp. PDC64]